MKKVLMMFVLFCLGTNMSYASAFGGYDAGAVNSQYMRDLRTHEAITRAKNKSAIVTTNKQTPLQQREMQEQRDKIINADIKTITFVNNASIPSSKLLNTVSDKINLPMSAENIASIRKDIMKYYQDKGFFSAVAIVSSQDSETGEVVIEIREGGKNSITVQE